MQAGELVDEVEDQRRDRGKNNPGTKANSTKTKRKVPRLRLTALRLSDSAREDKVAAGRESLGDADGQHEVLQHGTVDGQASTLKHYVLDFVEATEKAQLSGGVALGFAQGAVVTG